MAGSYAGCWMGSQLPEHFSIDWASHKKLVSEWEHPKRAGSESYPVNEGQLTESALLGLLDSVGQSGLRARPYSRRWRKKPCSLHGRVARLYCRRS